MEFKPWLYVERTAEGLSMPVEYRMIWFKTVRPGWRFIPDGVKVMETQSGKLFVVMTVSAVNEKGQRMESAVDSLAIDLSDEEPSPLHDQYGVSFLFNTIVSDLLDDMGFSAETALELGKGQAAQQPAQKEIKQAAADKEPRKNHGMRNYIEGIAREAHGKGLYTKLNADRMFEMLMGGIKVDEATEAEMQEFARRLMEDIKTKKEEGGE